jgi:hypothetical protein
MKWAGWICLLASFMPYYTWTPIPPPRPLPAGAGRAAGDLVSLLPPESGRGAISIGLPFSPWFAYSSEAIYTPLAGDAYRSRITTSGRFLFLNWSAAFLAAGMALLLGHRFSTDKRQNDRKQNPAR